MKWPKNFKLPKIKIDIEKLKNIPLPKVDLSKIDKKTKMIIGATIIIVVITIVGRKSPSSNEWDELLPSADLFDDSVLTGGKESSTDDRYTAFFFEVYDLIKDKYWNILSDEQLGKVIQLGTDKLTGKQSTNILTSKEQIRGALQDAMKDMDDTQKKDFIAQLTDITLANLEPFGRSRLYTAKKKEDLSNTVKNINPNVDHYDVLEVPKEASETDIEQAYEKKISELNTQPQTNEVVQEKQKVEKAREVLADNGNKNLYDTAGINPTIENRLITPQIFYIHITKFSPTTVEELVRVMDKVDQGTQLDTLIIDLRGNIGGAIDGLPYFLGPFIGKDQYAYQFFKRGEKEDFKTVTGWLPSLVRYKKVVVLTDNQVQSSGEVFAAALKKFNVGVIVGTPTKGHGTVESVFKINNQLDPENEEYSVFLVHSLTLRDDGVPIEGKGVIPSVNINSPTWESELYRYFHYQELVNVVRNLINNP